MLKASLKQKLPPPEQFYRRVGRLPNQMQSWFIHNGLQEHRTWLQNDPQFAENIKFLLEALLGRTDTSVILLKSIARAVPKEFSQIMKEDDTQRLFQAFAAKGGDTQGEVKWLIDLMLEHKFDLTKPIHEGGDTFLHLYFKWSAYIPEKLEQYLRDNAERISQLNDKGRTCWERMAKITKNGNIVEPADYFQEIIVLHTKNTLDKELPKRPPRKAQVRL